MNAPLTSTQSDFENFNDDYSETNNGKCWIFTAHASIVPAAAAAPGPDACRKWLEAHFSKWPSVDFLFFGWEQAPSTGGWHAQGYVRFEKKVRLTALKKLNSQISFRAARADWECNWRYCTKDDPEPFVIGDLPDVKNNGDREKKRYEDAWSAAVRGDIEDIPADIKIRYYHGIKAIGRDHQKKPPALENYNFEWVTGRSGSGKSTLVRRENPDHYAKEANKWFCGFQGEACVIIDDLDPEAAKYLARYVKVWTDVFPFVGEFKGTSMMIRPKKFVITSQYTIDECFSERDAEAIKRRAKIRVMENYTVVSETIGWQQPAATVPAGQSVRFVAPETHRSTQPTQLVYPPCAQVEDEDEIEYVGTEIRPVDGPETKRGRHHDGATQEM